ncbi:MAG: hypothetical protein J6J39_04635 [Clostridia bacterium]|nr:hypothetical protein [Clostridia bacterium]
MTEICNTFLSSNGRPFGRSEAKNRGRSPTVLGKAGITVILTAVLLLENRVFNGILFGMIFITEV